MTKRRLGKICVKFFFVYRTDVAPTRSAFFSSSGRPLSVKSTSSKNATTTTTTTLTLTFLSVWQTTTTTTTTTTLPTMTTTTLTAKRSTASLQTQLYFLQLLLRRHLPRVRPIPAPTTRPRSMTRFFTTKIDNQQVAFQRKQQRRELRQRRKRLSKWEGSWPFSRLAREKTCPSSLRAENFYLTSPWMFKSGFESSASVGLGIKKLSTFWSNFALNAFEKKKNQNLCF